MPRSGRNEPSVGFPHAAPSQDGLGGLVDQFKRGGLEDIIKSWIGTGPNKPITPN